jgi:hypothetical protein
MCVSIISFVLSGLNPLLFPLHPACVGVITTLLSLPEFDAAPLRAVIIPSLALNTACSSNSSTPYIASLCAHACICVPSITPYCTALLQYHNNWPDDDAALISNRNIQAFWGIRNELRFNILQNKQLTTLNHTE